MSPSIPKKKPINPKFTTPKRVALQTPPSDRVEVIYATKSSSKVTKPDHDKREPPSPSPLLPSRLQRKKSTKITLRLEPELVKPQILPRGETKDVAPDETSLRFDTVAADLYSRERKLRQLETVVSEREVCARLRENEVHAREMQALNSWHRGVELSPTSRYEYNLHTNSVILHRWTPERHDKRWWGNRPVTKNYDGLGEAGKRYMEYDRALFEREMVVHHRELNVVRREWDLVRREAACSTHELTILQALTASVRHPQPSLKNLLSDESRVFPLIYPQLYHAKIDPEPTSVKFNEKGRNFSQSGFPLMVRRNNATSGYIFLDWQRIAQQVASLPHKFPHPTYSGYPIPTQIVGYVKMVLTLAGIPYSNTTNDNTKDVLGFTCNGGINNKVCHCKQGSTCTNCKTNCGFGCEIEFGWDTWDYRVKWFNLKHLKECLLVPQMKGYPDISQYHANVPKDSNSDIFTNELVDSTGDYLTYMSCLPPMTSDELQSHLKAYFVELRHPQAAQCLVLRKWSSK